MMPWPISDLPRIKVTRLSGVMRTQALSGLGGFFSCCGASCAWAPAGRQKPITSAVPPAAVFFRKSRRFTTGAVAMEHLRILLRLERLRKNQADLALPAGMDAAR